MPSYLILKGLVFPSMKMIAAALAALLSALLLAAPAHAASDAQIKWQADVAAHGGPTDGVYNAESQQTLGDAVCGDIKKGNAAANVAIEVSNDGNLTMKQAMIVTYWAITDLCPDQISQRQDHWKDGS